MFTKVMFPLYELCFRHNIFDSKCNDVLKYKSYLRKKTLKNSYLRGIVENHQNEKEDTTIINKQINKDFDYSKKIKFVND